MPPVPGPGGRVPSDDPAPGPRSRSPAGAGSAGATAPHELSSGHRREDAGERLLKRLKVEHAKHVMPHRGANEPERERRLATGEHPVGTPALVSADDGREARSREGPLRGAEALAE